MSVRSIVMVDETNTYPKDAYGEELAQGSTYELIRIYKVENTDGPDQYFKFSVEIDSYGNVGGNYSSVEDSIPRKFVEVKPVEKTVTAFEVK